MVILAKPTAAQLVMKFPAFIKPKDLLPHSKQPGSGL